LKMVSTRAQDGKVQLVTEMAQQQVVRADQRALKQILLNLLSNAVKFTPAGGKVSVAVAAEPGADIRLTVADTGIGIHQSALGKVFQPFYQVDHTATRSKGGTGLGLAIVKHLVDLHGGSIGLDSAPGRGTTVTVTLPAQRLVLQ
jgi:two-component system, cell cycle sensor histidine kinase PleC